MFYNLAPTRHNPVISTKRVNLEKSFTLNIQIDVEVLEILSAVNEGNIVLRVGNRFSCVGNEKETDILP